MKNTFLAYLIIKSTLQFCQNTLYHTTCQLSDLYILVNFSTTHLQYEEYHTAQIEPKNKKKW